MLKINMRNRAITFVIVLVIYCAGTIAWGAECSGLENFDVCEKAFPLPIVEKPPLPKCGVSTYCPPIPGGNLYVFDKYMKEYVDHGNLPDLKIYLPVEKTYSPLNLQQLESFRELLEKRRNIIELGNSKQSYEGDIAAYKFGIMTYRMQYKELNGGQ